MISNLSRSHKIVVIKSSNHDFNIYLYSKILRIYFSQTAFLPCLQLLKINFMHKESNKYHTTAKINIIDKK